ncbi:MAG: 30S ribosomal protein S4 [Chitinophagales bacterium]|jgi:small subunit ribosomal protein S4|nr:30S ribosomal protein S4 [Chitinophagales bacterium]
MARYTGPASKIARNFGEPIFGADKAFDRKNYPSGMHGMARKKKQQSDYALQLKEKQKAKYTYGILERQFRKIFVEAARKHGVTGENLLKLLEARLDNTVFRLGIAPTRRAARQLVSHNHIEVNGVNTNSPSFTLRKGDVVTVTLKAREMEVIQTSLRNKGKNFPWLQWNEDKMEGTFIAMPERDQIPENIKEQLIVELYSK